MNLNLFSLIVCLAFDRMPGIFLVLRLFFTWIPLFLAFSVSAYQEPKGISSVQASYNSPASPEKVDIINELAKGFSFSEPDSIMLYALDALRLSRKISYEKGQTIALLNLSKAFYIKGGYGNSLNSALLAYQLGSRIKYDRGISVALNNIGLIYLAQDKFDQAIVEFSRALEIAVRTHDRNLQARNNFNLGICYDEKHQSEKAIPYLEKAIELSKIEGDEQITTMALNRMGETYLGAKNYPKALSYYKTVTENSKYSNNWEYSFAYSGMAQTQLQMGNYRDAIKNAHKGLDYARLVKARWDIERSLKILYSAYAAIDDHRNAFKYLELNKIYSDSLYSEAKEKEINSLHLQQKQLENQQLYIQNTAALDQLKLRNRIILIIAVLAGLLIISKGLVFYYYTQKSRLNKALQKKSDDIAAQNKLILAQKQELEEINQTKDQLFSIIGHDLRGPFASIIQGMDLLRQGDLPPTEMKLFMDNFYEKITVMSFMLNNLVLWAESQKQGIKAIIVKVDLSDSVHQALIVMDFLIREKNIIINHARHDGIAIDADADHVRVIIHNLVGNAIKFTPRNGHIDIFYVIKDSNVTLHVKDSGVGMSEEKIGKLFNIAGKEISSYGTNQEKGIGIGLMLVKKFADENGAKLEVKSGNGEGTEFSVTFLTSQVVVRKV